MKKKIFILTISVLSVIFIVSCSKTSEIEPKTSNSLTLNLVKHYTEKFIQNEKFSKYFGEMFINQYNMGVRRRNEDISRDVLIDSTAYYTDLTNIAIAQAQIMLIDSGYAQLSAPQIQ